MEGEGPEEMEGGQGRSQPRQCDPERRRPPPRELPGSITLDDDREEED